MARFQIGTLLLIVLSFSFSVPAAADCQPVDLRDQIGAPLHQGNTGHCFAHSSATLITAKLGFRPSPLDLATNYILANPDSVATASRPELQAYLRAHPDFIATWRADRNDEPENFSREKILGEEGIFDTGGEEVQTIFLANIFGLCEERKLPSGKRNYERYLKDVADFHRDRLIDHDYTDDEIANPIGEVTDPQARLAARSFLRWVDKRCGARRMPNQPLLPEMVSFAKNLRQYQQLLALHTLGEDETAQKVFLAINEQLDLGKPVSIGYDSSDLFETKPGEPGALHASVVAARREVDGECYYFVRNSYGHERRDYRDEFKRRYERGGVWIRNSEMKSLYSAVWIR